MRAGRSPVPSQSAVHTTQFQLTAGVLAIALGLALWIAAGSLVLAIADGLGDDPLQRLLVGLALVALIGVGLWRRDTLCSALLARPWVVAALCVVVMALVAVDGVTEGKQVGPYLVVTVTPLGIAVVVGRFRQVWLCVALLEACFVVAVLAERAAAGTTARTASLLGAALAYPFAALVAVGLASRFKRFIGNTEHTLAEIRDGAPSLTPELTRAVLLDAGRPIALLEAPSPLEQLTPTERQVVDALTGGTRPKQIAFAWGVSVAAIRKHIRNAKRKTGARTLPELAAMSARHRLPHPGGEDAVNDDR